jgi:transposase
MSKSKKGGAMKSSKHSKQAPKNLSNSTPEDELEAITTSEPKTQKQLYQAIVALREEKKMPVRAIAGELNVPKSTVQEYLSHWKQKTPVSELKKPGRPKKLTSADKRFVRQLFSTNPNSTVKDVCNALLTYRDKKICASTVRKMLSDMGLRFGKPQVVPLLTDLHRTNRMKFCKEHRKLKLTGVFFSDESYIEVGGGKSGVWFKRGNRPKVGKAKFTTKMMFWGAISCHSKSPLFAIDGSMNSVRYIAILRDQFLPWVVKNRVEMTSFQQDNASCHISKAAKSFFESQGIQLLGWPANSPDLNPIENVWAILKERVRKRCPETKEELQQVAIEEWDSIPQKVIKKTVESFEKRCAQIISRGGEKCDY